MKKNAKFNVIWWYRFRNNLETCSTSVVYHLSMNTKLEVRYVFKAVAKLRKMYSSFFSLEWMAFLHSWSWFNDWKRAQFLRQRSKKMRKNWQEILLLSRRKWNVWRGSKHLPCVVYLKNCVPFTLRYELIVFQLKQRVKHSILSDFIGFKSSKMFIFTLKIKAFKKKHLVGNIFTCIENKSSRTINIKCEKWFMTEYATQRIANESIKWKKW